MSANELTLDDNVIRDDGAMTTRPSFTRLDYDGHRGFTPQQGLQIPGVRKRSNKNQAHKKRSRTSNQHSHDDPCVPVAQPGEIVHSLIEKNVQIHPVFSEMEELHGEGDEMEWKETARWVKFEEDVEEGGNRWSKPHVATLGLHSLFELRSCILHGMMLLNMEATNLEEISDKVLNALVLKRMVSEDKKSKLKEILLKKHRHQHEKSQKSSDSAAKLSVVRTIASFADLKKSASKSHINNGSHHTGSQNGNVAKSSSSGSLLAWFSGANNSNVNQALDPEKCCLTKDHCDSEKNSSSNQRSTNNNHECTPHQEMHTKANLHFMKKLPPGSEASNILVGELDFLDRSIITFVRLREAQFLGDLTEVPLPTRFIFIILGPKGNLSRYHEIGRAMATLMCDEVFHDVAYKARDRQDLLAGLDEFLDAVTVLPPGEWDPNIRIEPPQFVPSQQSRMLPNKPDDKKEEDTMEEEQKQLEESGLKRTGRLFGGFINDIKRKRPFYISDFKDAFAVQCLASFFFIYFACLTPIVTFGGLLGAATKMRMAAMESLLSGAIVGTVYALFSGQPLTILGSTGPVLVFEATVFDISTDNDWDYLPFRFWIGIWTAVILITLVALDASALVCYITRFTEEIFATLISLIFIVKAIEELLHINDNFPLETNPALFIDQECNCTLTNQSSFYGQGFNMSEVDVSECIQQYNGTLIGPGCHPPKYVPDVFLMSVLLFIGTFIISVKLKDFKNAPFFPTKVRQVVSDFAVIIAISSMSAINYFAGLGTPTLDVPNEFKPTWEGRTWLIPPFGKNPWWSSLIAIVPALLCTILIFMDQQITAVIVNRKENKLKKGCGYHLDLFIVAICIAVCGLLGLPWFVAATVLSITHVNSLKLESECAAPGEKPHFLGVREQRVTHLLVFIMIGLSVFLTRVLQCIPMPVLYGVFLYMGTSSLKGSQFVDRIMLVFMPQKYQPDYMFLRHVPIRRIHVFSLIQVICLSLLWLIKSYNPVSILFPLMVAAMIGVRKLMDFFYSQRELRILDHVMPESTQRKQEELTETKDEDTPKVPVTASGDFQIQLSSGNVLKVPLNSLHNSQMKRDDSAINISEALPKTGTWQNIDQNSCNELNSPGMDNNGFQVGAKYNETEGEAHKRLSIMNEDDENDDDDGIVIKINPPTPLPSRNSNSNIECETHI